MEEKLEIFLCYLTFHVSLFFLAVFLLSAYFIDFRFSLLTVSCILAMYVSYRKGKYGKLK